ncbi:hypothetical protein Tco_0601794, partial [Tanacetum coccineum]
CVYTTLSLTNNQLRSSSNLRNQATVQDGRVTVQKVQGRQGQNVVGSGSQGNASGSNGNTSGQAKVVKCYNCQAPAKGKELDEEQLAFLVDPGVTDGQVAQTITHNAAFQTDDLDAYDFDYNDIFSVKTVLMANLSSCDSYILSDVPYSNTFQNDMMNQSVKELQYSEQTLIVNYPDNEITNFGKCFVPQQELSAEQKFWLQSSDKNYEEPSTANTPVKIEVPSGLPKFDKVLHDEITEVQTVFTQMEAAVEQCSVDRKCCKIQQKQFLIENDRLLDKIISQEIVNIVLNSSIIICDSEKKNEDFVVTCNKCLELEAEILQAKDTVISKLKETIHSLRDNANPAKVKQDIDEIETINIELEHSVAKLLSENEKLHKEKENLKNTYKELYDSIKPSRVHAKEQCDSLIVNLNSKSMENADLKAQIQEKVFANAALKNELRKLKGKTAIDTVVSKPHATTIALGIHSSGSPLDSNLDSGCKYVQRIQEVLVYVRDTCPCLTRPSEKLVVVTPKNKDKKVRFIDSVTSSSNTQKQVNSYKIQDSNNPLLHSTGVICSNDASRSKPTGNTRNNRISQPSSSNKTNKVEDQYRNVKSRKNVMIIPAKRKNKKQIWKPTGKVYTEIGYKWKPTGHTFTIVKNKCPLTRFTSTKVVTLKETTIESVLTSTQGIKVFQIILWYLDSGCSKYMTRNRSQLTNFDNKFLGIIKFGNDQIAKIMGYSDYQIRNVTISRVYYVEGLRHNLFSVGQLIEDLGKLKAKSDVGIFNGYAPAKKAYRIYNRRTRQIMETINVDFDELTVMASKQSSSGPALHEMTPGTLSSRLRPQPPSLTPFVPPTRND